jgi:hypothetical protein
VALCALLFTIPALNPAGAQSAPAGEPEAPAVPLTGNTWIFQTMAWSLWPGEPLTNEFISGHLTLFPAGSYEMNVRIGDFSNAYSGGYSIAGEQLLLQGYGEMRFARGGVRLTLWDSAGSIYGLALEGTCDAGICATRP